SPVSGYGRARRSDARRPIGEAVAQAGRMAVEVGDRDRQVYRRTTFGDIDGRSRAGLGAERRHRHAVHRINLWIGAGKEVGDGDGAFRWVAEVVVVIPRSVVAKHGALGVLELHLESLRWLKSGVGN